MGENSTQNVYLLVWRLGIPLSSLNGRIYELNDLITRMAHDVKIKKEDFTSVLMEILGLPYSKATKSIILQTYHDITDIVVDSENQETSSDATTVSWGSDELSSGTDSPDSPSEDISEEISKEIVSEGPFSGKPDAD